MSDLINDLKNDLKLEVIEKYGVSIYQDTNHFKFSIDAFCLAEFSKRYIKGKGRLIDLCSGTGIVGILIKKEKDDIDLELMEIQDYGCEICKLNLKENDLEAKVFKYDLREIGQDKFEYDKYDYITVNPPYMKSKSGLSTKTDKKDLAKIEPSDDFLKILFEKSFKLLKDRGQMFMVHKVERLVDILSIARQCRMEPKDIQFIRNQNSTRPFLMLIRFVKNAGHYLRINDDMII